MKTQITFMKIILPAFLVWVNVMNGYSQTTDIISVKTADVAKFTNTHKQWRFEMLTFRMYNTVAGKYLTAHSDGSVSLEAKDETASAANQYWALTQSPSSSMYFKNIGTAASPTDYIRNLGFTPIAGDNGTGTTTLSMQMRNTNGNGESYMNLDNAQNYSPTPGVSYTLNTISWYTRSIVANAGNTSIVAIDNNNNTAYPQWQFEEVNSVTTYPEMTFPKRIYNTVAQKYLSAQAADLSVILSDRTQSRYQYWETYNSTANGVIIIRNTEKQRALNQSADNEDLVPAGTKEVHLYPYTSQIGNNYLQLDDNTLKIPVQGTDYSIQSISWYLRSLICNIVDNTGGNLTAAGLTDSELANSNLRVNAGELAIDASKTIKSINVAPGAKLTLNNGQTLTATNGITLQSDATGTATLKNNGTYSGNITAQQYLGTARNWYVSSPVVNPATPGLTTTPDFADIAYYYEYMEAGNNNPDGQPGSSTAYWKGLNNGSSMAVGKGYIAKANAGTTISFSGTPNNGNITTVFDLTRNDLKGKGFNLAGNPYPSYIDWADVALANPNLDNTFYYRTKNTLDAYTFVTYNGAGSGSYVVGNGTAKTTITRFIPPTQAFWVRVNTETSATKMYFNNDMREHRDDNNNLMKAPRQDTRPSVRLQLHNGSQSDALLIYQDAGANNDYDSYDSPKMMNNSTTVPDLYSMTGDEKLVINGLNVITENMELPLGFSLKSAAALKIKATELNNLPEGMNVYLLDKSANTQTLLTTETEYSFTTTESTTNNESRFSLVFKSPGITTADNVSECSNQAVFVNAQNELVIIAPENSKYAIYTLVGEQVKAGKVTDTAVRINTVSQGVYLVKVNNQTSKVIIR